MRIFRYLPICAVLFLGFMANNGPRAQTPPTGAGEPKPNAEAVVLYSSVSYESDGHRDPFLNPLLFKRDEQNPDEEQPRGQPPPGISGMLISQVRLQGTSFRDEAATAVFVGPDKRAYFLQEGDRLFDGYLKRIEEDSTVLVRETRMRSGKVVMQEVTKRLRNP